MIKIIKHHISKDFNHLRYFLMAWVCLLLLPIMATELWGMDLNFQIGPLRFTGFLKGIMLLIWLPRLIQSDPAGSDTASWKTKPVSPLEMILAKGLYILFFMVLPSMLADLSYSAIKGIGTADLIAFIPGLLLGMTVFVLPLWLLAALTSNFIRFVLSVVAIVFITYLLASLLVSSLPMGKLFFVEIMRHVFFSHSWMFSLPVTVFSLGLVFHRYFSPKKRRTILLAFISTGFIFGYLIFIQWDIFRVFDENRPSIQRFENHETGNKNSPQIPRLKPDDPRIAYLKMYPATASGSRGTQWTPEGIIFRYGFHGPVSGLPDGFLFNIHSKKDVEIHYENEKMQAPSLSVSGGFQKDEKQETLKHMFQATPPEIEEKQDGKKYLTIQIDGIPEKELSRFCFRTGTLIADVHLDLYGYKIVNRLPIEKAGRVEKDAEYLQINDFSFHRKGCTLSVEIQQSKHHYFLADDMGLYNADKMVIYNKKRKELLFPEQTFGEHSRYEQLPGVGLSKLFLEFKFSPARNEQGQIPGDKIIHREWLKDAELILLDEKIIGRTVKSIRVENIFFGIDNDLISRFKIKVPPLDQVKLPQNPTPSQVEKYLHHVFTAKKQYQSRDGRELLKRKLEEVGPGHIELLAKMAKLYKSEWDARDVIKRIAGPGSKEQVLNILEDYPELFVIACREGWDEEVTRMLVEKLEKGNGFTMLKNWLEYGCPAPDTSMYPLLKKTMLKSLEQYDGDDSRDFRILYSWMKRLPGFELSDIENMLWNTFKHKDSGMALRLLPWALSRGKPDAMDIAVKLVEEDDLCECHGQKQLVSVMHKHTDLKGDYRAIAKQLKENKGKFRFDKKTKTFRLR